MPYTVDEERFTKDTDRGRKIEVLDISKPHGVSGGIPVKEIPHLEFPRVVYKHPREPFKKIIHRNAQHEIVEEEMLPAEHLTRIVADTKELAAALKEGWVKEPYISKAPDDPNANLY